MNSKEYWNKVAKDKSFSTPFQMDIFKEYVDKDSKILDIGCGYGRTLKELYNNGYTNILGIDFSDEMINLAKEKNPIIEFKITSGSKLDFRDDSFDAVILIAVLTCILDTKDQKNLIKEIYRVLKKDGVIYINDYLLNDTKMYLDRYEKYKSKFGEYGVFETNDGGVFRHHKKEYLDNLLNCFKKEKSEILKYITMNGHEVNGIYYIGVKTYENNNNI